MVSTLPDGIELTPPIFAFTLNRNQLGPDVRMVYKSLQCQVIAVLVICASQLAALLKGVVAIEVVDS